MAEPNADLSEVSEGKAWSAIPELFYDIIAIILPGYALLAFFYFFVNDAISIRFPVGWAAGLSHFVIAYLIGHLLYSLSIETVTVLATKLYGSPRATEILDSPSASESRHYRLFEPNLSATFRQKLRDVISKKWSLSAEDGDPQLLYELCRHYIAMRNPDRARVIRKEQAYGELSRSLVLVGLICAILAIPFGIGSRVMIVSVSLLIAWIAWRRYLHARKIDAYFVYIVFHIINQAESRGSLVVPGSQ